MPTLEGSSTWKFLWCRTALGSRLWNLQTNLPFITALATGIYLTGRGGGGGGHGLGLDAFEYANSHLQCEGNSLKWFIFDKLPGSTPYACASFCKWFTRNDTEFHFEIRNCQTCWVARTWISQRTRTTPGDNVCNLFGKHCWRVFL